MKVEISRSIYFEPTDVWLNLVGTISLPSVPVKGMYLMTPEIDEDGLPFPYSPFVEEDRRGIAVEITNVLLIKQKPGVFRYSVELEAYESKGSGATYGFITTVIEFYHCVEPGTAKWSFDDGCGDWSDFLEIGGWAKDTGHQLEIESDFFKGLEAYLEAHEV
jgi:hypothetical protein